jgi:hypothetical protein
MTMGKIWYSEWADNEKTLTGSLKLAVSVHDPGSRFALDVSDMVGIREPLLEHHRAEEREGES